jgi:outer membrane protein TolC
VNAKHRILFNGLALVAVLGGLVPLGPAGAQEASRAIMPTPVPSPILPAVPSVAPGYVAPQVAPTAANIVGVTQQPFVGLALSDAIGMALLKNPNLAVSAAQMRIASYQVTTNKGAFDLQFQVEPSATHSIQPPENPFFAGPNYGFIDNTQTGFEAGVGIQTENGGKYNIGFSQAKVKNNTSFNSFNPYYPTSLNASVTQPLLKGSGMNPLKRQLKLSIVASDISQAQTLIDVSNSLTQVENTYWDLVSAWRNVAIQEDALQEAIAQQQSNVRLANKGAAAPIDAVESSTQVSTFQDDVFSALQHVSQLQNELKGEILANPADPIWMANLVPTSPVLQLPAAPTLPELVTEAMATRPEVRQAVDSQHEADINTQFAKNQALPQADIVAGYQSNGFAGNPLPFPALFANQICPTGGGVPCPTPPPVTQGGQAQSYHTAWGFLFPAYNIGVQITQPLGSDLARGLKGQAKESQRIAAIQKNGVAERITFEARNALQTYQSALSRLFAASQARAASDQVYASELRKFHNGASTTFLVLQRQVELNQARGRELLAQTDLNKAVVEIQRTSGSILTQNGVDLQTVGSKALSKDKP